VEGYGYAVAEDQGSAIKGNRIDLAYNDFKTATDYGIQNVKVYILE
jgi:3D (Asp-Asp-Asp) domain-containing protein